MARKRHALTSKQTRAILAALDQIERYTWATRNVLLKTVHAAGNGGGAACGLDYAISKGGAQCGTEYALKVGGAACLELAQAQIDSVPSAPVALTVAKTRSAAKARKAPRKK